KPHPETFLKGAEFLNIAPEFCLVFEDGQPGIDAAIAGGMPYIDVRPFTPKVSY
ncbi:MAG: beta-phosphoglucomutase family hydrolase, partial [Cytophagaceae bacterium]|nr:beta-phosphoglucomutase family hydrolase [Cytophagaceae bacterium]